MHNICWIQWRWRIKKHLNTVMQEKVHSVPRNSDNFTNLILYSSKWVPCCQICLTVDAILQLCGGKKNWFKGTFPANLTGNIPF